MIFYLVRRHKRHTVDNYLNEWNPVLRDRIEVIPYETLAERRSLAAGRYVFADLERLSAAQFDLARSLEAALDGAGWGGLICNRPSAWLPRTQLWRRLFETGQNAFTAYPATGDWTRCRYPVFVRHASFHTGAGDLLYSPDAVREAIRAARRKGLSPRRLLVTEFRDTSDQAGLFRKYAAFRVGDRIVPRHLIFSHQWMQKKPDLLDPAKLTEEQAYLNESPHEHTLRHIFDTAGLDYGRIDYGVYQGHLQVWEINTNPVVMFPRSQYASAHLPHQHWFAQRIAPAFEAFDPGPSPARLHWRPGRRLKARLQAHRLAEWADRRLQRGRFAAIGVKRRAAAISRALRRGVPAAR